MNKKNTILIMYPPGGYGTFLEWALNYYSGEDVVQDPFLKNGSAHKFLGNPLEFPLVCEDHTPIGLDEYFSGNLNFKFARFHPFNAIYKPQSFVNMVSPYVKNIIYLEPNYDVQLLLLDNIIDKTQTGANWFLKNITNFSDDDPVWQKRENISFWFSGYQTYISDWAGVVGTNVISVPITNLINNFESVIEQLMDRVNLPINSSRWKDLPQTVNQWHGLQRYLSLDKLCRDIIESTVTHTSFTWSTEQLNLTSEAFIQWALRDLHSLDLRCYNLNEFPTSTQELRKHLINE